MYTKLVEYSAKLNAWQFIAVALVASFIIVLPFALLVALFPDIKLGDFRSFEEGKSVVVIFVVAVSVYPCIETFLFQTIPHYIFRLEMKLDIKLVVLLSSLLFGISHYFSFGYVVYSFLVGIIFMTAYCVIFDLKRKPFLLVTIFHSVRNAITFICLLLLE